ncbi:MAG: sigma-70 family RNA polymerase sigma factor [Candidatus Pacebacteria bacterium]|nr:sigma-70 family RNA polymerase sigma factor [Candidatus Paceibacterota bacterium]MDD2757584.1 sigma-70 family RNA polymerase sigma factor [Candidatus Paceibacterota bacterium]MDD3283950.1 sigma-70 family RNA polymerase sigma factor [Candidatus Paceibacterota bacterium]MDD3970073.1 sigma-70 family RNA polymerase sigma factor [Candidatus Paceibacterota bacterium]MDD4738156.1 sigma-70 family RNA polymerase sigma factor [Candidatus Paceibacterota bacterium]
MQPNNFKEQFFSQIYDEHVDKIYRFVFFKVNNEALAQDITSETFTRLWKEISEDKEVKNPHGFLFKVARNLIFDYYRTKDHNPINVDNMDTVLDNNQDIEKDAVLNDDMRVVLTAMDKLNDDYRVALSMYYIEQEPVSEVAKALSKSNGAARVTIHRAMRQLKKFMEA